MGFKIRTSRATNIVVDAGGLRLHVTQISASEKAAIRDSHTKVIGRGGEASGELNREKFMSELFCKMVTSWESSDGSPVTDMDTGEVLACNESNKRMAYEYDRELAWLCIGAAEVAFSKREEEAEKNSEPGVSGTSPQEELRVADSV